MTVSRLEASRTEINGVQASSPVCLLRTPSSNRQARIIFGSCSTGFSIRLRAFAILAFSSCRNRLARRDLELREKLTPCCHCRIIYCWECLRFGRLNAEVVPPDGQLFPVLDHSAVCDHAFRLSPRQPRRISATPGACASVDHHSHRFPGADCTGQMSAAQGHGADPRPQRSFPVYSSFRLFASSTHSQPLHGAKVAGHVIG